jgi:hypothetical protein
MFHHFCVTVSFTGCGASLWPSATADFNAGFRMSIQFFKQILGSMCPHRFSWPHSGANGHDYQVCLICGVTYEYDWSTMRRTRLLTPPDEQSGAHGQPRA